MKHRHSQKFDPQIYIKKLSQIPKQEICQLFIGCSRRILCGRGEDFHTAPPLVYLTFRTQKNRKQTENDYATEKNIETAGDSKCRRSYWALCQFGKG